jgi:hypothetical protein
MLCSEIREILAEEEEAQCRKAALDSLVCRRAKLIRESLGERMRRAQCLLMGSHPHVEARPSYASCQLP